MRELEDRSSAIILLKKQETPMQTKLTIEVDSDRGPKLCEFELDSKDLAFLPQAGDKVQLPGMLKPLTVTDRLFKYTNPATLQIRLYH